MNWKLYPPNPRYSVSDTGWIYDNELNQYQKFFVNKDGYYSFGYKGKIYLVHRLILETFVGKSNKYAHHINEDKLDNRLENLAYVTPQEHNVLHPDTSFQNGELHPNHKLTKDQVLEIRSLYKTGLYTQKELSNIFMIGQTHINRIVNHRRWKWL